MIAATEWLRTNHPELFSTSPAIKAGKVWGVGYTNSSSSIIIDVDKIDEISASENRMAEYVSTLAHELQYSQDFGICMDNQQTYENIMRFMPSRHTIIESRGEEIRKEYLRSERYRRQGYLND